jgi:large subunit ribosomal protein L6
VLTLGYSHEVFYVPPTGVNVSFEKPNLISVSGSDKTLVGQTLAEIISFRKTEPYKGKGIKLFGKKIIRKEGKKK